jgi:hypothetical protein
MDAVRTWIGPLAWAWLIIIGVWMLTPNGPQCIACGPEINLAVAIVSIVLGAAGLATRFMPARP